MSSFFPHDTETENQQSGSAAAAQEPAFQAVADDQTQPKGSQAAAMEIILPAHKNTPGTSLCL